MAIDPPYRLDPFRNIVNVSWGESLETPGEQYFVWLATNYFHYPQTADYWAPITKQQALNAIAAGEAPESIINCGWMHSRSALIANAATGPDLQELPPDFEYTNFIVYWQQISYQFNSWHVPFDSVGAHGRYLYRFCWAGYEVDDYEEPTDYGTWLPPIDYGF